jgi:DNA-binding response OmpR family regulator
MLSLLVVDDDPALLEAMRAFLSRAGNAQVRTARTAREGLSILSSNTFDAIVLDYDMPEIDGLSFLKILRSRGDTTPVVIFTGVGREHAAIEALNNGADFFVQKGENPETALRIVLERVSQAVNGRIAGRPIGSVQKTITDMINFSSEPTFGIDREGKVIAWNEAMEQLTGMPESAMIKKGDYAYAEPFFGVKKQMLIDLVFEKDEDIQKQNYLLVSRVKQGPVIAVTKGVKPDGKAVTLWMKAMPLYDRHGNFIAAMGAVRDITATVKDVPLPEPAAKETTASAQPAPSWAPEPSATLVDRILGTANSCYKEGVRLYAHERNYREAVAVFDKALAIDATLAHVWNDRGFCYRELGEYDKALKSFLHAVELAPESVEVLYELGVTLETIGVIQKDNKYLDAALQTFHMVTDKLPSNESAWNHIGVCLKEMGRPEYSRIYFDRARDIKIRKKDTPIPRKRDEYI